MKATVDFENCLSFINMEIQPVHPAAARPGERQAYRAVAISRLTGSGAHSIAEELAILLNQQVPPGNRQWTVFDRNLVEKVLEDHHLPQRLSQFMPEDRVSEMRATINELLGLHPPSWTLVSQTSETILRLADLGSVILIGRGANVVTNKLGYVFHVRLVSPLEARIATIQKSRNISLRQASELIQAEDGGRARYVKQHFGADINNPLLYHLVINTERMPVPAAAKLIADAMGQSDLLAAPARP
jgi:cytidylate kinase